MHLNEGFHGHGLPEPIGLEYVAGRLTDLDFSCCFSSCHELRVVCKEHTKKLSLLSAITSEYPQVLEAARASKKRGEITILGGYHVCGCNDDLAKGPFDYVVIGEGEEVATAIAKAHFLGKWDDLNRFETKIVGSVRLVKAEKIIDLDTIPLPLRSENRLSQYLIYDLMWPTASRQHNPALVLGSRGCAHNCDFCASSTVWGRGIRLRSPEKVVEELHDLKTRFGTNTIVFIDQSFGQSKQWTLDLLNAIRNADLGINWYHQSNLTVDRGVIKEMAEAGCTKIGFGLEGISPQASVRIKPVNPWQLDSVNELFDYCNSLGLFVKAYLMIGFPWETQNIIDEYLQWIQKIRVNQIKISYFTPFPGTRAWDQYSSQLLSRNWADFDTVRLPVVHNPHISVEQYHAIRKKLFLTFYGSSTYADVTRRMIHEFPHYMESYKEFVDYLSYFDMISGNETWLEWISRHKTESILMTAER